MLEYFGFDGVRAADGSTAHRAGGDWRPLLRALERGESVTALWSNDYSTETDASVVSVEEATGLMAGRNVDPSEIHGLLVAKAAEAAAADWRAEACKLARAARLQAESAKDAFYKAFRGAFPRHGMDLSRSMACLAEVEKLGYPIPRELIDLADAARAADGAYGEADMIAEG